MSALLSFSERKNIRPLPCISSSQKISGITLIFREPCICPLCLLEFYHDKIHRLLRGTLPLPKKIRVQPSFFGSPVYVRVAQFFRKKNIRPMFRKIPCGSIEMFVRLARGWWSGTLPLPKKYRVQPSFFGSLYMSALLSFKIKIIFTSPPRRWLPVATAYR